MSIAKKAMNPAQVLLDIGCGIKPQPYIQPYIHICVEPYDEYVNYLQEKIAKTGYLSTAYVILKMSWTDVVKFFPEKSVDTVMLVDVIEHLEKEEGRSLLVKTEKIARQQVILFTPYGYMPQYHPNGRDAWGFDGGYWQEHKSGWLPEDFQGDDWNFFACRDFHLTDNADIMLEKPYGAFWAIKTNQVPLIKKKEIFWK